MLLCVATLSTHGELSSSNPNPKDPLVITSSSKVQPTSSNHAMSTPLTHSFSSTPNVSIVVATTATAHPNSTNATTSHIPTPTHGHGNATVLPSMTAPPNSNVTVSRNASTPSLQPSMTIAPPNGTVAPPNATVAPPNGTVAPPNATVIPPNGTVVPPGHSNTPTPNSQSPQPSHPHLTSTQSNGPTCSPLPQSNTDCTKHLAIAVGVSVPGTAILTFFFTSLACLCCQKVKKKRSYIRLAPTVYFDEDDQD